MVFNLSRLSPVMVNILNLHSIWLFLGSSENESKSSCVVFENLKSESLVANLNKILWDMLCHPINLNNSCSICEIMCWRVA